MGNHELTSPVVPGAPVRLVENLEASRLIENYRRDYGVDVSDYFHGLSQVAIYACSVTSYRFYYPFTLTGKEELYAQLSQFPWYYTDRPEHALAERHIRPADRVLEIGCGAGFFLKRMAAHRIAAVGLDLNHAAVAQCRAAGLDARQETIEAHAATHSQAYDVVCAFHILEHVVEVHAFLTAALACLRPGGKLILAVPNSEPYAYGFDRYFPLNAPPHHMGLWNKQSLKNLAKVLPIRVVTVHGLPMLIEEYERYITFSLLGNSVLARKRDWLLWRIYKLQQKYYPVRKITNKVTQLMTYLAMSRNIFAIFKN